MKIADIAQQNGINPDAFANYLKQQGVPVKSGLRGMQVDDSVQIGPYVANFKAILAEQQRVAQEQAAIAAEEERVKRIALSKMLITSGFTFDGYRIVKYSGYISGDDAIEVPRSSGGFFFTSGTNVPEALMASLTTIRRNALNELKEAAYALGCNAVIGVDFDYITLDPQYGKGTGESQYTVYEPYVFGVTANGNAVIIEKDETR